MTKPVFETYWQVNGEQHVNINTVAELVMAGAIAVEVPAEQQYNAWKLQKAQEAWHQQAIERHAKHLAETNHRQTPEGQREAIVRHAAQHPGGIVSGASNPVFDELDQYGTDATNVFK